MFSLFKPAFRTALVFCFAFCVGCATVFTGTKDDLAITSEPDQAHFKVFSAGGALGSAEPGLLIAQGVTPQVVELSRKNAYIVKVKLKGYQEAVVKVNQDFNYWVICSAVCGVIGVGIDALSGAFWNLDREQIAFTLVPAKRVPANQGAPAVEPLPPPPPPPSGEEPPTTVQNFGSGGEQEGMYLVMYRRDDDGRLRHMAIPLVAESP
jgi:hypothetical protein